MKSLIKQAALMAIITVLMVSKSFAASDYLLELDGIKGETKSKKIKLTENSDGSFSAENIPAGTYNVIYKAKQGKTGSTKRGDGSVNIAFEGVVSPRDPASGLPTGKSAVQSPRDPASGQATGKRQHKPFTITKEWDANTPMLIMGQITVGDDDGDGVDAAAKAGGVKTGYDVKMNKKV